MLDEIVKIMSSDYVKERKQFACMIAYELGVIGGSDSLRALSKCIEYAQKHDFVLEKDSDEELIDTELARDAASKYAKQIAEEFKDE